YRLAVAGRITTVSTGNNINNCFAGLTQYCSAIVTPAGPTPLPFPAQCLQVNTQFFNVASTVTDGFNIESSYQFSLEDWDMMSIPAGFHPPPLARTATHFT